MRFLPASKLSILGSGFLFFSLIVTAQYKNDNVLYKTVYLEEFCKQFKASPNALLLDVRSQGEYDDTSSSVGMNIGRLKPTRHIDIQELPARWKELIGYKDQPVYVVCSHSQRSRRASKMLADSGFTNIINVNGGLTTFNLLNIRKQCNDIYETHNQYNLVSPLELCSFLMENKNLMIVDVRKDSSFNGIAAEERQNAHGKLKNAINIPYERLEQSLAQIPPQKTILVVDDFGRDAVQASKLLLQHGYTNVNMLFSGMDVLLNADKKDLSCINNMWSINTPYKVVTAIEFDELAKKEKNLQIVDVRSTEEFNNQSKQNWRNIGNIKNATNIPLSEIDTKTDLLDKNKPVLVYHFGGPDPFKAAKVLTDHGFTKVFVLTPGLFSIRWQAANLKGKSSLKDWVVNIPEENR